MDQKNEKDAGVPTEVEEEALDQAAGGGSSHGTGGGAGKVSMQDIHFTKPDPLVSPVEDLESPSHTGR